MIERYDVDGEGWDQDKDGDWCMAIEVLAIEEEVKRLKKELKGANVKIKWLHRLDDERKCCGNCINLNEMSMQFCIYHNSMPCLSICAYWQQNL